MNKKDLDPLFDHAGPQLGPGTNTKYYRSKNTAEAVRKLIGRNGFPQEILKTEGKNSLTKESKKIKNTDFHGTKAVQNIIKQQLAKRVNQTLIGKLQKLSEIMLGKWERNLDKTVLATKIRNHKAFETSLHHLNTGSHTQWTQKQNTESLKKIIVYKINKNKELKYYTYAKKN